MRWYGNISKKCQCSLESDAARRGGHLDCVFVSSLESVVGLEMGMNDGDSLLHFFAFIAITVYICMF